MPDQSSAIGAGLVGNAIAPGIGGLLGPALMAFLPTLLGGLFGDPQKKLRRQAGRLISPTNVGNVTNQNYQQLLGSPAYAQAQGNIAAGANQTSANVARALGQAGIGGSGTGAILSSLSPSLVGSQQAQLQTGIHGQAQQQAMQQIQQQLQLLMGTSGPSQTQQFAGVGLEALTPLLGNYFKSRYPHLFPTG